jgi:two-component system sensor histidine kinase QseC
MIKSIYSLERRLIFVALLTLAGVWLTGVAVLYFESMHELEEMAPYFFNLDIGNEHLEELEEVVTKTLFYPLFAGLPVMALLLFFVLRQGLEPLREIEQSLAKRRPGQLDLIEAKGCPSEIAPLIDTLNELLKNMSVAIAREKRLTADAAHELRTPLAAIRANVDAIISAGRGGPDDQSTQYFSDLLASCDRATHSITQMLELARLDSTDRSQSFSRLELTELVRQEAANLLSLSPAAVPEVELDLPEHCHVDTIDSCLRIIIRNLLSNATKFAGSDGLVRVSLALSTQEHIVLSIEDSGPGLSEDELKRLGERFFRVHHHLAGAGLGWSIIRRCADLTGSTVRADSSSRLGGLRVQVFLGRSQA